MNWLKYINAPNVDSCSDGLINEIQNRKLKPPYIDGDGIKTSLTLNPSSILGEDTIV